MERKAKKAAGEGQEGNHLITEIVESVDDLSTDWTKFLAGTNVAGTRARGAAQKIKKLAQELRTLITEIRASRKAPAKSKGKGVVRRKK